MNFSIILPSRERTDLLFNLLMSIQTTTKNLSEVEVFVAIDDSDKQTLRKLDTFKQFPFFNHIITKQAFNFSKEYYNPLAMASTGRYVQLCNDDCIWITPNWDELALPILDSFPHDDRIFLGRPFDTTGCNYSCFPLMPRETINALGWIQNPGFTSWGADIHLDEVFKAIDRQVHLPFTIDHICCHNKKRRRDRVSSRMGRLTKQPNHTIQEDITFLRNYLQQHQLSQAIVEQHDK